MSELTAKQSAAVEAMLSGENVFLSGDAGTGKSYVLREFLKKTKKNVVVCAPTGIAAINVGGATLHRVFKIPSVPMGPEPKTRAPGKALKKADVIIVDEISMCRFDTFEYVAQAIRRAEAETKPKQLIVVGDFFQLPPVITDRDREALEHLWGKDMVRDGYAFQAPSWGDFNFKSIILDEPMRQKNDAEFVANLNAIRRGDRSVVSWFNQHHTQAESKDFIYLCPTNSEAEAVNKARIAELTTEPCDYAAKVSGTVKLSDMPTSEVLTIKPGMRVMSLVNDTDDLYQNGTLGTVVKTKEDSVTVLFDNGSKVDIERNDWEVCDYEVKGGAVKKKVIGTFNQLPLKPAYAITIHKSQGQTYDKINVNPRCFAIGQLYVALSRCKRIAGLHLTSPIQSRWLLASPDVVAFYELLESSDASESDPMKGHPNQLVLGAEGETRLDDLVDVVTLLCGKIAYDNNCDRDGVLKRLLEKLAAAQSMGS